MSTAAESSPGFWQEIGERWNRFWFTPTDPLPLCVLRLGAGGLLLLYLALITPDLYVWVGSEGLVSRPLYERLVLGGSDINRFAYWSVFNRVNSPTAVYALHGIMFACAALFTAGCFTRVTSVLALASFLQYIHRAPLVTSQLEPLLAMLLLYLCIGPCGAALSVDAWRKPAKERERLRQPSWLATISLRLIQIHLAMFYVMMATAKLQGEIWWRGDAIWTLMSPTRSRLLDWSFLRNWGYFLNFWTHAHLLYELTFAALVWNRLTRPIVLWTGVVLWLMMLLASGLVSFSLAMIVASFAFVPAATWRRLLKL